MYLWIFIEANMMSVQSLPIHMVHVLRCFFLLERGDQTFFHVHAAALG